MLFIFSLSPFSMYELYNKLLEAGLGIVADQHLDGGPFAQLYLNAGTTELELSGTGGAAREIPNMIGFI